MSQSAVPTRLLLTGAFCLAALAGAATVEAQRWPDERAVGPFAYHADFELAEYEPLFEEMALMQRDLAAALNIQPPQETVHVFLFSHRGAYQSYVRQYFPRVPYRRALFIKGRGPGMVFAFRNQDFEIDLRHESTHALLHSALPMVPLWLDEGLAEYFEMPAAERPFDHPHLASVRWNLNLRYLPEIEALEALGELGELGRAEYRDSWAWVHFMLHGPPEARQELIAYLNDIRESRPPGLLSERLSRRIPNLRERFTEHFRTWRR